MSRPNSKISSRPGSSVDTSTITFDIFVSLLNAKMKDAKSSKNSLVNTLRAFDDSGAGLLEIKKFKSILLHLAGGDQSSLSDEVS